MNFPWLLAFFVVASGTALIPLTRALYGIESKPCHGNAKEEFTKPFFCEFVMFVAMFCCYGVYFAERARKSHTRKTTGLLQYIEEEPMPPASQPWYRCASGSKTGLCFYLFCIAASDFVASYFIFAGNLWVPASFSELLSSTNTVFTAALSYFWLKSNISKRQTQGILGIILGLAFVAGARMADEGNDDTSFSLRLTGCLFIMVGQFIYGIEFCLAEVLLADAELSHFYFLGTAGFWGILMFVPIFGIISVTPNNSNEMNPLYHEDVIDTLCMIKNDVTILSLTLALLFALFVYNIALFNYIREQSGLGAAVCKMVVAAFVWLIDLGFYYVFNDRSEGNSESWTKWSWMELVGYFIVVLSTFLYHQ